MTLRLRLALWFGVSMCALIALITFATHRDLHLVLHEKPVDSAGSSGQHGSNVHVGYSDQEIDRILSGLRRIHLTIAVPLILLSVVVG